MLIRTVSAAFAGVGQEPFGLVAGDLHDPNDWISMRVITDEAGVARVRITGDHHRTPSVLHIQIWY